MTMPKYTDHTITDTSGIKPRTQFRPEVAQLALRLSELTDLVDNVNSDSYSDHDRAYLRSMLPPHTFTRLIYNLADLRSARHRHESHTLGWPIKLTIDLSDELDLDDVETPDGTERS